MWNMRRSGGTRVIFEVANRLAARGHDVSFTSLENKDVHRWFPLRVKVNYLESTVPILRRTFPYMLDYTLRELTPWRLDRIRNLGLALPECDINVATYCLTAFAVHRSGRGTPFYYVQHYEPLFYEDEYMKRTAEETYGLPFHFLTVSSWLRSLLIERHGKDSNLCLNGVDRATFYPRGQREPHELKRIMCIGRPYKWKGMQDLISAIGIARQTHPKLELIIVSQNNLAMPRLDFSVKIVRAPRDDDLAREYSISDAFVNPSWYEGFSLPVLEAMSCGVPVVTTNVGPGDFASNEQNALVVRPRKPDELAHAINRVLTDESLSSRLAAEGIRTAERFTWEKTTAKVDESFRSALSSE
jgi:glycosyltransferase involved in cell wall biosynthesis